MDEIGKSFEDYIAGIEITIDNDPSDKIFIVDGEDTNAFGAPKSRAMEIIAKTHEEAKKLALEKFPTMTITSCHKSFKKPITSEKMY